MGVAERYKPFCSTKKKQGHYFHVELLTQLPSLSRKLVTLRSFRSFDSGLSGSVDYHEFCDFLLHGTIAGKKKSPACRTRSFFSSGANEEKTSRQTRCRRKKSRNSVDETDSAGSTGSNSSGSNRWGSGSSSCSSGGRLHGGAGKPFNKQRSSFSWQRNPLCGQKNTGKKRLNCLLPSLQYTLLGIFPLRR